jgi:hypothetical protein
MRWLASHRVLPVLMPPRGIGGGVCVSELAARHVSGIRAEATLLRQIAAHIATIREARCMRSRRVATC